MQNKKKRKPGDDISVVTSQGEKLSLDEYFEVEKSNRITVEATEAYKDSQKVVRNKGRLRLRCVVKHENDPVIYYAPEKIWEIKMSKVLGELKKRIRQQQKETKNNLKQKDTIN